jgi:hypothetical protein
MITNFIINKDTKESSGLFFDQEFTVPPKFVNSEMVALTEEECLEILVYRKEKEIEIEKNRYISERQSEYPSLQEQMDMQYWDSVNGTTVWQDAINDVKAKYPKPE